jgi:hypothetical protein
LNYKMLVYFTALWYNVWQFGVVCGPLVYFPVLVFFDQEKSGNPGVPSFHFLRIAFRRGKIHTIKHRSQSYDFLIHNYNASVVVCRLERFCGK